jgi:hypothetical protein
MTSTAKGLSTAAAMIFARLRTEAPALDRLALQGYLLGRLVEAADVAEADTSKPSALDAVREEVARFRFAFFNDEGRAWSEEKRRFYRRSNVQDEIASPRLLAKLRGARGCERLDDDGLTFKAQNLVPAAWAALNLPNEAEAALGPTSAAADEVRNALLALLRAQRTFEKASDGFARSTNLAMLASKRAVVGEWTQPVENYSLFARRDDRRLSLAVRFDLLHECGAPIPGARSAKTFFAILERYGLALPGEARACGLRVGVLAPDFCEALDTVGENAASIDAERGASTEEPEGE